MKPNTLTSIGGCQVKAAGGKYIERNIGDINDNYTIQYSTDNGATYRWDVTGCNGVFDSTTNISLPNGNTRYKVFVARTNGDNDNITKCCYWSMDFNSGCWH